jgi:hypothetical protein
MVAHGSAMELLVDWMVGSHTMMQIGGAKQAWMSVRYWPYLST